MDSSSRRPIKTRSAEWARSLAARLADSGVSANAISGTSVVAALAGAACFVAAGRGWIPWWAGWPVGAVMVQLRLICNLMDGMVAVEGGKKSPTGGLWNEVPDRFADTLLLMGAGWACGLPWTGALASWAAVMTAYVRTQGAELTGEHDFCGPFAKPQRMALLTIAALVTAVEPTVSGKEGSCEVMRWSIVVLAVGTCLTIVRRLLRVAVTLKGGAQ
jgi:phosphatidylglycerophosphate synthase